MNGSMTPTRPGRWGFDRWSERRSLILCAIGAVAGLVVAGAGLFTAQGFYEGEIGNAAQGVQVDDPQIWTDTKGSAAVAPG